MASFCISNCVNDTKVPLRPTYVNLHKWPDSDAAFVRSMSCKELRGGHANPGVVDSISCRQLYLRSYTFSRKKESVPEKISKKFFGRVKKGVKNRKRLSKRIKHSSNTKHVIVRKCLVLRRVKEVSCSAFLSIFRRLLSCTTKVDVAHDHHGY